MLTCLRVRNFAIIDALEVEFGPGLNVVTGETGAGKSILVSALQLVLGGRGRPELVRTGEKQAEVEALFDLSANPGLREGLAELDDAGLGDGALKEMDELIIRRVVLASGRTRAYVNGRLTTAGQLSRLAEGLADISSQHEHHSLVDPATHLRYLDAFGGAAKELEAMASAHARAADAARALDVLRSRHRERSEREDLLRYQLGEIEELAPEVGEVETLQDERARLRHSERLLTSAGGAEEALYASDDALCGRLSRVASDVRSAAEIDGALSDIADQIEGALTHLEDAAAELGSYSRGVELDPARLGSVEERLDQLGRLKRKYGGDLEAVLRHRDEAADELEQLDSFDEQVALADAELTQALEHAGVVAMRLRARRQKAASRLSRAITKELVGLGMGGARVAVEVAPIEERGEGGRLSVEGARLSPSGIDRAQFLIATNKGEEARSLSKVASGGELSRAMLAIKRVLAGLGPCGLYVFDEVDTGVGGAVAEVIGQRLRDVAEHSQVLCITHLPQISVYGDTHYQVHKRVVGGRTRSEIIRLGADQRLEEVARMLGGVKITARTRAAAAEMLGEARPN